jgi:ABC-2 type transport system permease protein
MTQALSLWRSWIDTLKAIVQDSGVLLMLVVAPVIYAFFYPWPYGTEQVTRVPVAVIDLDHSGLSRQMARWAMASPRLDVRWVGSDEQEAREALWRGEIAGYAVLPEGLKRRVIRGQVPAVSVESHGGYALLNKAVLTGFSEVVGTVSAGIEIKRLQARGQSLRQAQSARNPISTLVQPVFNTTEGYGSYVVPAVSLLIIQQTLLMGAAMLMATWAESSPQRLHVPVRVWLGRVLALSTPGWASGLFYMGWCWTWQGYPRGGNPGGALLLLALYIPTICALGCVLGLWMRDRERVLQVLLFTALPMAFVSGFSWPVEALPAALQWARWLIPATPGIEASLRLNQMGADIVDVAPQLGVLLAQGLVLMAVLLARGRPAQATAASAPLTSLS